MPQLDFSAFFLQFLIISSLLFWLTWFLINNILEIIYIVLICRKIILEKLYLFKFKYNFFLKKLIIFNLNLIKYFNNEINIILILFYNFIKLTTFKIIKILNKIIKIFNYFLKFQLFLTTFQLKLSNNLII